MPERRLAAILAADVVGYSALMAEDEAGTLEALRRLRRELFHPAVAGHRGKVVKAMGDGWLVEFASAVDAVSAALRIQTGLERDPKIRVRIGIHVGDITHEDEDIYGDGVNVAARLEALAEPGAVLISDAVHGMLDGTLTPGFDVAGAVDLKNIPRPVRVWVRGDMAIRDAAETAPDSGREDAVVRLTIRPFACSDPRDDVRDLAAALTGDLFTYLAHALRMTATITETGGEDGFVLNGTLRTRGDRLRLEVRLDDRDGAPIWTGRLDGDLADGFDWQDEAGAEIASGVYSSIEEAARARLATLDPWEANAGTCMLRAKLHSASQHEDARIAFEAVEAAIEKDPDWAMPYAWGVIQMVVLRISGLAAEFPDKIARQDEWTRRGHELAADDALAQLWLAYPENLSNPVLEPFQAKVDALLRRWPWHHEALFWGAVANLYFGEAARAELYARRMTELLPSAKYTAAMYACRGSALIQLGRDEDAIAAFRQGLEANPRASNYHRTIASALAHLGRKEEARDAIAQALEFAPGLTIAKVARLFHADTPGIQRFFNGLRMAGLPEGNE